MVQLTRLVVLVCLTLALTATTTNGQVLVNEQFNGNSLDLNTFTFSGPGPESFFGRTQLNSPSLPTFSIPDVSNGTLRLTLESFNPLAPGANFLAEEIRTQQTFAPTATTGISYDVRARFVDDAANPLSPGLVGGIFTLGVDPNFAVNNTRDEVDFELLSSFPDNFVLTNVFDDLPFNSAGTGQLNFISSTFDTTEFNDYRIESTTSSIDFFVNDVLVRSETANLAIEPQDFRLNINAPDQFFSTAFSSLLQPTTLASENETFIFEVDSLVITEFSTVTVPEPSSGLVLTLSSLVLIARRRRSRG